MTEIISVRFKSGGKEYYFNPNGVQVQEGQEVIIETSKGIECATCVKGNTMIDEMELVSPLRPVLRIATQNDLKQLEENRKKEAKAFQICQDKILEHGLEMKLIEVEYSFDGSKILFFFTADGRVDFRALVKDLASIFRTRIELRQIGVRDEAKMLGGLGICGRPFCCSSFLGDFHPVSIKMAKTQNLSLNPTKISGACGRLMCCLKYEQDAYTDLLKRAPKQDSLVETPDGVGVVNQVNLLRETSKVILDSDPDTPRYYKNSELTVIRSGKGKRPAGYEKPEEPTPAQKPRPRLENVMTERAEASAPQQEAAAQPGEEEAKQPPRQPRPPRQKRPQQPQENAEEGESRDNRAPRKQRPQRPQPQPKGEHDGQQPAQDKEDQSSKGEGQQNDQRRSRPHYRKHRPHTRKPVEGASQAPKKEE